jgi:hypothetical protein
MVFSLFPSSWQTLNPGVPHVRQIVIRNGFRCYSFICSASTAQ